MSTEQEEHLLDEASLSVLDQEVYTLSELAERLKTSRKVLYRALKKKELIGYKVGREWRIPRHNLRRYLAMNTFFREILKDLERKDA